MVNSKHSFWIALVFTVVIFSIGLIFGYFIEQERSDSVQFKLMQSEINLLDEQIRNDQLYFGNLSCDLVTENTFDFADRIYEEALQLEKYDSTSKFGRELKTVHKRYDLMRLMLYQEGLYIRENCNQTVHVMAYFFDYDSDDVETRAQQTVYSRILIDLKNAHPDQILLVPIASNLELSSVDLAKDKYGISKSPSILIDGRIIVDDIEKLSDIENMLFDSNKE